MNLIVELIKYLMILLIGIYTYYSFTVFRIKNKRQQNRVYTILAFLIFILHFVGNATLLLQMQSMKLVYLYGGEVLLFVLVLAFYRIFYPKLSKLLMRNMLMLLAIGFIILTRLNFDLAVRQVFIVAVSFGACLLIPFMMKSFGWLRKLGWVYGAVGILLLVIVLIAGTTNRGATNWLEIGGFSFQPSEFVKLLFVLSIAALFREGTNFKRVIIISAMAAVHVLILVLHKDLGGALILFITYIFMLYVATAKPLYLFSGLLGGSLAAYVAYFVFSHVRVRVMAWKNPFQYIDKEGYQITQSLFAIGTGGWFGMGLNRGLPTSIPVVESDFIFSAISEELGGLFAICVILIYVSCFVMFINLALQLEDAFYRLVSIGFAVMFIFQTFLSIGGVIKFIPSTGVTLPLISQGGTSVFTTITMFMILQGVYMRDKSKVKDVEVVQVNEMEDGQ
jgi:cell division protein FtsW (lipid II flippase)